MKAESCFSMNMDPYRAGIELGEGLVDIRPEVIFLFPTIHYNGSREMAEGIYDVLESDNAVLIGATGDGFYERSKVADVGVAALGIDSAGSVGWRVVHEPGAWSAPYETTRRCMARLNESCKSPGPMLYFLVSDFRTDAGEIAKALRQTAAGPVVGGLAGDDSSRKRCFLHANRETLTDSLAILAMDGAFAYDIRIANKLRPIGKPGKITEYDGRTVRTIDHLPATDFMERELGRPLDDVNRDHLTLKLMDMENRAERRIRSLLLPVDGWRDRGVELFGSVRPGDHAQVHLASPDSLIEDVRDVGGELGGLPFDPVAALMVSCLGRKNVLADDIENEAREILGGCPTLEALAGFPSYGEFGPARTGDGYTRHLFHNKSLVLLLIGGETA